MAETQEPQGAAVPPADSEDVDVLFKAQMWLFDLVARWWKHVVLAVGLILLGTLVYGTYDSWRTGKAEDASAEIAKIDFRMPKADPLAMMGFSALDNLSDPVRVANLEAGAQKYTEAAASAPAEQAALAHLKAAELWVRLGKTDEARTSFQAALDADDSGPYGFAANAGLATLALQAGQPEDAITRFRALADDNKDVYGEQALRQLVTIYHSQKDTAHRDEALMELVTRYPNSSRNQQLADELGVTLPKAPTPAPTTTATPGATPPTTAEGS